MQLINIIETIFIISIFCCGLTIATSEHMIGYFLRKPFDKIEKENIKISNQLELHRGDEFPTQDLWGDELKKNERILYWMKPILLCCTCMASFWGILVFGTLHGWHYSMIPFMAICCVGACFLNAFFYSIYNRL